MKLNDSSALFFEKIADFVIRKKYFVFFGMIIIALIMGLQLKTFRVDTSTVGLLHETDPDRIAYNEFRDQFGRDQRIIAVVGPVDVYSKTFLEKFQAFHNELKEGVPHLDDITSLVNARDTRGEGNTLIVEDFLKELPETNQQKELMRERIKNNRTYQHVIIDETEKYVSVLIKTSVYSADQGNAPPNDNDFQDFESEEIITTPQPSVKTEKKFFNDKENQESVDAVYRIVAKHKSESFPIHISGSPAVSAVLKVWMMKDMRRFTRLAILTISVILFVVFRRFSTVLIAISTIGLSFVCTFGTMALFDIPIKIPTVLIPSFILAVGVCYGVHILSLFYRNVTNGEEKNSAIRHALGHSGLAIVLTSMTTAGGLLSFIHAKIAPIEDLGIFSAIGVTISLVYSIFWLPSLLAILPPPKIKDAMTRNNKKIDDILTGLGEFAVQRSRLVLGGLLLLVIVSLVGMTKLQFTHRSLSWLPVDSKERIATNLVDEVFKGTLSIEVVLDTKEKNGVNQPEVMKTIDNFTKKYATYKDDKIFIGKTLAVSDILKETNRALNENKEEFYKIPHKELISQEMFLFEISSPDDMADFVDSQFQKTRIYMKIPWVDSNSFGELTQSIGTFIETNLKNVEYQITGLPMVMARTLKAIIESMITSYSIAMAVITIMMIFFIGNLRLGLISMVPNILPILTTLGIMGWFGVKLDAFTMTIGAIAIGLAVDDTIHFMNNFKRYYAVNQDIPDAVKQTLLTSGRAMLFTSIILSSGFMIYSFSFLNNLDYFGFFTALTILFAFFADCLIAPALIAFLFRNVEVVETEEVLEGAV